MSRYIDADRIDWRLILPKDVTIAGEHMWYNARKLIDKQPTADVVEVVRCKDCKHYSGACFDWNDDDFCSHAERREDEI